MENNYSVIKNNFWVIKSLLKPAYIQNALLSIKKKTCSCFQLITAIEEEKCQTKSFMWIIINFLGSTSAKIYLKKIMKNVFMKNFDESVH